MEKYFYTKTGEDSYVVKKAEGNKLLAVIDDEGFHFLQNSEEKEEEVKDFCRRNDIGFPYSHELVDGYCYICDRISHNIVAIVEPNKEFHFVRNCGRSELEVKWYCVNKNLCSITPLMHKRHEMMDIIATGKKEVVAIINKIGDENIFFFFEWSSANEVDVRLYCKLNNLYSE